MMDLASAQILAPQVRIKGQAFESIARRAVEQWIRVDRAEYVRWRREQRERRRALYNRNAMTKGKHLMGVASIPFYPMAIIGRAVGNFDWYKDEDSANAFYRVLPECRINTTTSAHCAGDKTR